MPQKRLNLTTIEFDGSIFVFKAEPIKKTGKIILWVWAKKKGDCHRKSTVLNGRVSILSLVKDNEIVGLKIRDIDDFCKSMEYTTGITVAKYLTMAIDTDKAEDPEANHTTLDKRYNLALSWLDKYPNLVVPDQTIDRIKQLAARTEEPPCNLTW